MAGLVLDGSGNLYGTTEVGGNSDNCDLAGPGCGTVYEIDTNGNETILHRFTGQQSNDGAYPTDALIFGADGDLYGTTYAGGAANSGTVFMMAPSGQVTVLHSFNTRDVSDGTFPSGGLVMDADGTIYGTTQEGGSSDSCWGGCGVVFKLDRAAAGNETVLLSFAPPAAYPAAPLTLDATGHLYGTTGGTGYGSSLGTVFELTRTWPFRRRRCTLLTVPPTGTPRRAPWCATPKAGSTAPLSMAAISTALMARDTAVAWYMN